MILVGDGGSTKVDWKLQTHNGVRTFSMRGINPFLHSENTIISHFDDTQELLEIREHITKIHYYGAGCSEKSRCQTVEKAFKYLFENAHIHINHDLLGSALATCRDNKGIACILGTGSNSCLFDGTKIIANITSLGYLVGDEGSGSYLGKKLLRGYFYDEFPSPIKMAFESRYPHGKKAILDELYNGGKPNVFLASFVKFMKANIFHPYMKNMVKSAFEDFLKMHVFKYDNYNNLNIHFVGSIAFHFRSILEELFEHYELKMGKIVQKPIDSLFHFHNKEYSI